MDTKSETDTKPMQKNTQKKDKTYSQNLKNLGGIAFEKMIGYKITKKFFIEDFFFITN